MDNVSQSARDAARKLRLERLSMRLDQAATWLEAGAKRTGDEGIISAAKITRAALQPVNSAKRTVDQPQHCA